MATIEQTEPNRSAEPRTISARTNAKDVKEDEEFPRATDRELTSLRRVQSDQVAETSQPFTSGTSGSNIVVARELNKKAETQGIIRAETATKDQRLPKPLDPNRGTQLDVAV